MPARSLPARAGTRNRILVLGLVLLAAAHGTAAQEGYAAREDCAKKTSPGDVGECLEIKVSRSNEDLADMEGRYRAALETYETDAHARDEARAAFELSVEEYRRYRDRQCEFVETQPGPHDGQLRRGCVLELNALRVDHLDVALRKLQ